MSGRLSNLGFIKLAIAALVTSVALLAAIPASSQAAIPPACQSAINSLNKQLPIVAKHLAAARDAKAAGSSAKYKRAKRLEAAARKVANKHRTSIRETCTTGAINALNSLCTSSIETYATRLNVLATRKYQLKRVKGNSAAAKKKRRTLKTQIRKLSSDVSKESKTFQKACSDAANGGGQSPTPPTPPSNEFEDPNTTVDCTPAQFHASLGCSTGVPTINIPSNPGGLTADYQVSIDAEVLGLCSVSGLAPFYSLLILVDGDVVATQTGGGIVQNNCNPTIDLQTAITGLTLSPTKAHRVAVRVRTSILLPANPATSGGSLTTDIAQL